MVEEIKCAVCGGGEGKLLAEQIGWCVCCGLCDECCERSDACYLCDDCGAKIPRDKDCPCESEPAALKAIKRFGDVEIIITGGRVSPVEIDGKFHWLLTRVDEALFEGGEVLLATEARTRVGLILTE